MKEFEPQFSRLRECIDSEDADGVQKVIFDLGTTRNDWISIPDQIVEGLLSLLSGNKMHKSRLASHVLNYFEFEAHNLSKSQKRLCIQFLKAHGNEFTDVHSRQIVAELREGKYLNFANS